MKKRLLAVATALALLTGSVPVASAVSDITGHWAEPYITYLDQEGVINPSSSTGEYSPERQVTRAEFMRYINRAFHFTEKATIQFADVPEKSWYYETIQIAARYGYISGTGTDKIDPLGLITREQAAIIIGRLFKLTPGNVKASELLFKDRNEIADGSAGYIKAAVDKGILGGYQDGSFQPKRAITRGEMAKILYGFLGSSLSKAGKAYTSMDLKKDVKGVTISESCSLSNATVEGDLYITEGLGTKAVTLSGVEIKGTLVISGGTVTLVNTTAENVVISSPMGQQLSVTAIGACQFEKTTVGSAAALYETGPYQLGSEGFSEVTTAAGGERLSLTLDASVNTLTLAGEATVSLAEDAKIHYLTIQKPASVTGYGSVYLANVQAADVNFASSVSVEGYRLGQNITTTAGGKEIRTSVEPDISPDHIDVYRNNLAWLGQSVEISLPVGKQIVAVSCDGTPMIYSATYVVTKSGIRITTAFLGTLSIGKHTIVITMADQTQEAVSVSVMQ